MCESMPMISRSDGKTFHVLLADRPLAYPQERQSRAPAGAAACFWYCTPLPAPPLMPRSSSCPKRAWISRSFSV